MVDDNELLRRYASERSQESFAELVRRHLDLVHSVALRQVGGDAHLAQDAAQLVFIDLARKAGALASHRALTGWLFTSTRFAAAKLVRGERRRRAREQETCLMNEPENESDARLDWERVRPALDEAVAELGEADREAVLLRFFQRRAFAEIGAQLRLTENTARMRVERALDKLRVRLERRGVVSSATGLASLLAHPSVTAAPAGLATAITSAAVANAGCGAALAAVTFMAINKVQVGIAAALTVAGVTGLVVQQQTGEALRAEVARLREEIRQTAPLREANRRLAIAAAASDTTALDEAARERLRDEAASLQDRLRALAAARAVAERASAARSAAASGSAANPTATSDRPPAVRVQPRPAFPEELRRAGIAGEVEVTFIVDSEGNVRAPAVTKATRPEFGAVSLLAVGDWKFDPGFLRGRVVNTQMSAAIVFDPARPEGVPELKEFPPPDWF